jgi:hypothetical protein
MSFGMGGGGVEVLALTRWWRGRNTKYVLAEIEIEGIQRSQEYRQGSIA